MTSRAARRKRRKKALITLSDGQTVPQPATGRDRAPREPQEDARAVVFAVRARACPVANPADLALPWLGCDQGRCIHVLRRDDAAALWAVWQAYCMAERTYRMRILGQTGEPQNSAIPMLPERMEADTGHTIDTRDSAERDRDAVSAWQRWQGVLGCLPHTIRDALTTTRTLWRDGPTRAGEAFVAALSDLRDAAERYDGARNRLAPRMARESVSHTTP